MVRADHPRVLRRHRGATGSRGVTRGVAGTQGHGRQAPSSASCTSSTPMATSARLGSRARCGSRARPTSSTSTHPTRPRSRGTPPGTQEHRRGHRLRRRRGFLYLTDRKSHMIISGGVNIYPQETENLLDHASEGDGRRSVRRPERGPGRGGEGGRPARRRASNPGPTVERELIAFCREHLARFKCPRTVDFEDELPGSRPASSTSGSCGTATGRVTRPRSCEPTQSLASSFACDVLAAVRAARPWMRRWVYRVQWRLMECAALTWHFVAPQDTEVP